MVARPHIAKLEAAVVTRRRDSSDVQRRDRHEIPASGLRYAEQARGHTMHEAGAENVPAACHRRHHRAQSGWGGNRDRELPDTPDCGALPTVMPAAQW